MLNTTLANNEATDSGGGIYFSHTDRAMQANLYNRTMLLRRSHPHRLAKALNRAQRDRCSGGEVVD